MDRPRLDSSAQHHLERARRHGRVLDHHRGLTAKQRRHLRRALLRAVDVSDKRQEQRS